MEGIRNNTEAKLEKLGQEEKIERLRDISGRLNSAILRTLTTLGLLLVPLTVLKTVGDKSFKGYEVSATTDKEGNKRWTHEDPETQQIVEYLAGLAPLPENVGLMNYKDNVWRLYLGAIVGEKPEGWDSFTQEDVEQFWISNFSKERLYNAPSDFDNESFVRNASAHVANQSRHKPIPTAFRDETADRDAARMSIEDRTILYNKLWQLMEKCGAPRIRPLNEETRKMTGRSYYHPVTHTIHMDMVRREKANDAFVAEMSHACQSHLQPFESTGQAFIDNASAAIHSIRNTVSFRDSYDELLYEKEGSGEYEAHKEIEPKIKSFLDNHQSVKVTFEM